MTLFFPPNALFFIRISNECEECLNYDGFYNFYADDCLCTYQRIFFVPLDEPFYLKKNPQTKPQETIYQVFFGPETTELENNDQIGEEFCLGFAVSTIDFEGLDPLFDVLEKNYTVIPNPDVKKAELYANIAIEKLKEKKRISEGWFVEEKILM